MSGSEEYRETRRRRGRSTVYQLNGSRVDRPVKQLKDFAKVYLETRESRTIEHKVKKSDLAYFDEASNSFVEEDIEYTAYIGNSTAEENLVKISFR